MALTRLPDKQEDREVYLREHRAARFVTAVDQTRKEADTLIMTVKGFGGEPEVLYVALEYAYHSGVAVTMAPDTRSSPSIRRRSGQG